MEKRKSSETHDTKKEVHNMNSYELLARKLDVLPNSYPPTDDGAYLRLLEKIFTPEEAEIAAAHEERGLRNDRMGETAARTPPEARAALICG